MTDDFDVSLRRRLESLASAVPVSPPGTVGTVVPRGVRTTSSSLLAVAGVVPVIAVVVVGTLLASIAGIGPFAQATGSPGSTDPIATFPSAPPDGPIEATTRSGDFTLTIRSPKSRYDVGEPIDVEVTFAYSGVDPVEIAHRREGSPADFGIVEPVIGDLVLGPGGRLPCIGTALESGYTETANFRKSGGWTSDDPLANEYESFFRDPELRLTEGTWHVYAVADFSIGECGADPIEMRVDLTIEVAPATGPTPHPTTAPVDGGVVDIDDIGDFELHLQSAKSVYDLREQIDLAAWYTYLGSDPSVNLAHFQPEMSFSIEQLDVTNPSEGWSKIYDSACSDLTLERGEPREIRIEEHNLMQVRAAAALPGGFGALLNEGVFHLPLGHWRISASVATSLGSCDDLSRAGRGLQGSIEISVLGNPEPIALSTVLDGDGACMQALGFGTVTLNPRTGLGWADDSGGSRDVIWPAGFSARNEGGLAVLVDAAGRIVAREGDPIRMGGGQVDAKGWWVGCELDPFVASEVNIQTATGPQDCRTGTGSHVGTLARAPETGLGIAGSSGAVAPVRWPFGYTAREAPDRLVLFDAAGNVVAWEGAPIGFSEARADDETLTACADVGRVLTST